MTEDNTKKNKFPKLVFIDLASINGTRWKDLKAPVEIKETLLFLNPNHETGGLPFHSFTVHYSYDNGATSSIRTSGFNSRWKDLKDDNVIMRSLNIVKNSLPEGEEEGRDLSANSQFAYQVIPMLKDGKTFIPDLSRIEHTLEDGTKIIRPAIFQANFSVHKVIQTTAKSEAADGGLDNPNLVFGMDSTLMFTITRTKTSNDLRGTSWTAISKGIVEVPEIIRGIKDFIPLDKVFKLATPAEQVALLRRKGLPIPPGYENATDETLPTAITNGPTTKFPAPPKFTKATKDGLDDLQTKINSGEAPF